MRANASAGFSIVTYTGNGSANQTAGHGLNVTPALKIIKERTGTELWVVSGSLLGVNNRFFLNTTAAVGTAAGYYPADSSTTLGISGVNVSPGHNTNSEDYVAYCFAPVLGYSAMGSYTSQSGNNFVYVGFRPKFLLVKKTAATADNAYEGWIIFDSERGSYNINQESLFANSSQAEGLRGNGSSSIPSTFGVDFLSNGFAFKDSSTEYNRADPGTYIYYAVAENPFKTARAR